MRCTDASRAQRSGVGCAALQGEFQQWLGGLNDIQLNTKVSSPPLPSPHIPLLPSPLHLPIPPLRTLATRASPRMPRPFRATPRGPARPTPAAHPPGRHARANRLCGPTPLVMGGVGTAGAGAGAQLDALTAEDAEAAARCARLPKRERRKVRLRASRNQNKQTSKQASKQANKQTGPRACAHAARRAGMRRGLADTVVDGSCSTRT